MTNSHLDRLLFAQGGHCFFCDKALPKSEASVEHLVASANGGSNSDDNCVACCKTLNHLLGSKSIKEKLQIVLNQRGHFQCPGSAQAAQKVQEKVTANPSPVPVAQKPAISDALPVDLEKLDLVLADLKKRGASRPRKVSTLSSTIRALIKQHHQRVMSDTELINLISALEQRNKLAITDGKVSYKLA